MKCINCESDIELKYKKDPETKMHSNYWWCETCCKQVDPFLKPDFAFSQETLQKYIDSWVKPFKTPIIGNSEGVRNDEKAK
jgi:hypothetical protein